jgi:c-di-GMP-binding flagellar brake protein YcgR
MADAVELRPGMRLMVASSSGALTGYFGSSIRQIDKNGLLIDTPRLDGEELALAAGQRLTMFLALHGRMYQFDTRVRRADLQVLLDEPDEVKRTERRAFYRLTLTVPCQMTIETPEDDEPEPQETTILDLSGGGVRMRTDQELAPGARLHLEFLLDGAPIALAAEVISSSRLGGRSSRSEAHCTFTSISRADQDLIVRFIFQKQREFSQKGVA